MKKLVSYVLAATLCLGMTTAVMAAGSVENNGSASGDNSGSIKIEDTTVNVGTEEEPVTLVVSATLPSYDDDTAKAVETMEEALTVSTQAQLNKNISAIAGVNVQVAQVVEADVVVTDANGNEVPGTYDIPVPGLVQGAHYMVIHGKHDGTLETLPVQVLGNNSIRVTFNSFSPIWVVAYAPVASSTTTATTTTSSVVATSPKTADAGMMVAMVGAIALAGATVASRKVNK